MFVHIVPCISVCSVFEAGPVLVNSGSSSHTEPTWLTGDDGGVVAVK